MKLIGLVLLFSIVTSYFFSLSSDIKLKSKYINEFYLFLKQLDVNLINYRYTTPTLIEKTGELPIFSDNTYIQLLRQEVRKSQNFNIAFVNTCKQNNLLNELNIYSIFAKLSNVIGVKDIEFQHKVLCICIEELKEKEDEYNSNLNEKINFYRKIGIIAGIFVVIILC